MMTQVNDKETEFPFVSSEDPEAIIVVMGLPFTRTKEVAGLIGRWARCPVLNKDHFLDPISREASYGNDSLPSRDEAERLHRLAFHTICSVACGFLDSKFSGFKCVVIKSPRICSTYELRSLLALADNSYFTWSPLILVECRFENEYQWKQHFLFEGSRGKWYEAHDWKEIEKAKEDYNAQAFHPRRVLYPGCVRRLVVDPYSDLNIRHSWRGRIPTNLASAIKFLLTAGKQELNKEIPQTVELRQLWQYLMEKKIAAASASSERSKYLCVGGACIFKYWESLTEDSCKYLCLGGACIFKYWDILTEDSSSISCTCSSSCCGVCEEQLVVGEAAYSCYFCVLALHKSSAEMPPFTPPSSSFDALFWTFYDHIDRSPEKHACKSCKEAGHVFSDECASCQFQTHLKSRLIPTIILNPDFHDHMISLGFQSDYLTCNGCGWVVGGLDSRYGCSICETYYHTYCPFWPKEFKHEHGGHDHLMKLMLSHDGAEEEEDYWCDICYKDIDPQVWFYSCQHCPYYVAHLRCTLGYVL